MSAAKIRPAIPALALPKPEAAAAVGMGITAFDKHVAPYVRVIRRGSLRVYPVPDLERWVDDSAEYTLADQHRAA